MRINSDARVREDLFRRPRSTAVGYKGMKKLCVLGDTPMNKSSLELSFDAPRSLRRVALAALTVVASTACSNGAEEPAATGGAGGSGAAGGNGGVGGTMTAGTGGATGGTGGATGGSAGSVSAGGAGGSVGGAAGAGGSLGGAGATGGSAGDAGGAPAGSGGVPAGAGGMPGGSGGMPGGSGGDAGSGMAGAAGQSEMVKKFSFFVTSVGSMTALAQEHGVGDEGFGGDLRYGEQTGLAGADKICKTIAERAMPGAGAKTWRAFLSTTTGGANNGPVHAKDRIGTGPWFDALGRTVAMTLEALLTPDRPMGADPLIANDLPNEYGIPNHSDGAPGCTGNQCPDNHQVLTGTNCKGELYTGGGTTGGANEVVPTCVGVTPPMNAPDLGYTCNDWTSAMPSGKPWCGHSWGRMGSGMSWMSSAKDAGCAPCIALEEMGGVNPNGEKCVGQAGGYGGFYCFALPN
jgi:hypothetical protein